jgi:ELP3 family radical SAM enzyme/protein acetyltransferase
MDLEDLIKDDSRFETLRKHEETYKKIIVDIYDWLSKNSTTINLKKKFNAYYSKLSHNYRLSVTKALLVYTYRKMIENNEIETNATMWSLLRKRPTRNLSGVDVITILMHPYPKGQQFTCKHDCYYCPNEPPTKENNFLPPPRSYLSEEPAVARGLRNKYEELDQINERITTLIKNGHEADKLEYIIEGGTHSEFPMDYLEEFHRNIIYAANVYYDNEKREPLSIEEETLINKTAKVKIIGLSVETRPDCIVENPEWLKLYRKWGVTRIQLGVQTTDNKVLKLINRGHTIETSKQAIEMCREYGFKVEIHIMLDLPGSSPRKDMEMLDEVFYGEEMQPDYIKLYPCSVTPWTVIQKWHQEGKYKPYANNNDPNELTLVDVMKHGLLQCPHHTRASRVVRDIPTTYIEGGNNYPSLRQLVEKQLEEEGQQIYEIRYRECGRYPEYKIEDAIYVTRNYNTPLGKEYFISLESVDERVIFGFIRVRITENDKSLFPSLNNMALVRELHVYGNLVPVGLKGKAIQHRGIGKRLLALAENIASANNQVGVAIISGIGVRGYYEKQGYYLCDTYMVKHFTTINNYDIYIIFAVVILFITRFITMYYWTI